MRTRRLGNSEVSLTTVGFGAAAVGAGRAYGYARRDDDESRATIRRALELGINWIDTAALYGAGRAERLVGSVLAELGAAGRSDARGEWRGVFVATKGGYYLDENDRSVRAMKRHEIRDQIRWSLDRLGLERVDLYQLHWPKPDEEIEEAWTGVAEAIDEGLVRFGGVSNFSVAQMERLRPIHPIASLQPRYSMLKRGIEDEIVPYCRNHGIGLIVYSPMESGILSGRFTKEYVQGLPAGDWRRNNEDFQEPRLSYNLSLVEKLRGIADTRGVTVGQLAIAWVLRVPEITSAIVGARRPDQIEQTAPAGDLILSSAELSAIDGLLEERERACRGNFDT